MTSTTSSTNRNLSVTEPHPTVPRSGGYIGGGRGGAGNFKKYSPSEITAGATATGPASRISLAHRGPFKRIIASGRGGAGNMIPTSTEESIFQFDEELLKKREVEQAPVYRIGRGGAGNYVSRSQAAAAAVKPSSERKDSTDSEASLEGVNPFAAMAARRGSTFSMFSRRSA